MKFSKNEILICFFFFLISFCKGIGLSNSSSLYLILYVFGLFLASLNLISNKFRRNELLSVCFILIIGLADYIIGKETTILFTAISLLFLKNTNIRNIIKAIFFGRLSGFILMIFLPLLGLTEMNTLIFYRNNSFITRYSFGYHHPNIAHSTFNLIFILYGYLYFEKINLKSIFLTGILNVILYNYTYSRTSFYLLSFYLFIIYFIKKNKKIRNLFPKLLTFSFIIIIISSFLIAFLYGKIDIIYEINTLLSGRIYYMNYMLNNYSIPLIKTSSYRNVLFDNGYFDIVYNGGILAFMWFTYYQIKLNKMIKKSNMYKESILIFIMLVYSLTESFYSSSIMNVGLIFFSYAIYKNGTIKNNY